MPSLPLIPYVGIVIIVTLAEIYLSRKQNMWYGLYIPMLFLVLGVTLAPKKIAGRFIVAHDLSAVVLCLIPCFINILIYLSCRYTLKRNKLNEINRMKIKDLS